MNLENYKCVTIAEIYELTNQKTIFATSDLDAAEKVKDAYNAQCTIANSPSIYGVKHIQVWMKKKTITIVE